MPRRAPIDPVPGNNSATDTDTVVVSSDLSVMKSDGVTSATPGGSVTYTITVTNAGPSNAIGAPVTDTLPASLADATWTCAAVLPNSCAATNGSGSISTTVDLVSSGSATFTLTATIDPAATGTLVNTVSVAASVGTTDPDPADNSATDTDTLTPTADVSVAKTLLTSPVVAGSPLTYQVVVSNAGPSNDPAVVVVDAPPSSLLGVSWTCTAVVPSQCASPAGDGALSTTASVAAGSSVTYLVTGTVDPAATGTVTNTATITPSSGVTDPDLGNNSATTPPATITRVADVSVTKDDLVTEVQAGSLTTYTILVSNLGPSNVGGVSVSDVLPAALTAASWTCGATAPNVCEDVAGTGSIDTTVDLVSGGSALLTLTATVDPAASGSVVNTVTAAVPGLVTDPVGANNSCNRHRRDHQAG